jgi:AraC-like DNA-binding protein
MAYAVARTLYLRRDVVRRGRASCATLHLTPLMRALVDHVREAAIDTGDAAGSRLADVIRDQLRRQRELPLFVPTLTTPLATRVAETIAQHPDDTPRTHDIAAAIGVSARTIERAFAANVRMTFGKWRQRTRVCRAIELLAGGMAVKDVAMEVGYETPSAFVAAFKRYVGTTPGALTR